MSTIRTNSVRRTNYDHFEPDMSDDPQVQKRLRASLEQIDYIAYLANREAVGRQVGALDNAQAQRMAVATAHARAAWVKQALVLSEAGTTPSPDQTRKLAEARQAFEELSAAYEAVRRMVERGYISFQTLSPR